MKICKMGYCNNIVKMKTRHKSGSIIIEDKKGTPLLCLSCRELLKDVHRSGGITRVFDGIMQRAADRASKKDMEFSLPKDWAYENWPSDNKCPILGINFKTESATGNREASPSLDRIDSNGGYTINNSQIISTLANRMKTNASKEMLIKFAQWVERTFNEENKIKEK